MIKWFLAGGRGVPKLSAFLCVLLSTASVSAEPDAELISKLNNSLTAQDYVTLANVMMSPQTQAELKTTLDWAQERWLAGATAAVPFVYSSLLWAMSRHYSPADAVGLKGTAAAALLYVLGVTGIDGARCGDRSAPADRKLKIMMGGKEVLQYLATRPEEEKNKAITIALTIESRTAATRDATGDVNFVCRFGLEETTYNLNHGTATERPARPGEIGRQIELKGDGKYVPSTVPEAVWRPQAQKAREALPGELAKLVSAFEQKISKPTE